MKPPKANALMSEKILYVYTQILELIQQAKAEGATEDDLKYYRHLVNYIQQVNSDLYFYDQFLMRYRQLEEFNIWQTQRLHDLQIQYKALQLQHEQQNKTT